MSYKNNVSKLATKLGITNDPRLHEEDIWIAELVFTNTNGETVRVLATDMNRGGRLFFQGVASEMQDEVVIDQTFLTQAAEFFAELWEPNPEPGKRKLLDAIRNSKRVKIVWK